MSALQLSPVCINMLGSVGFTASPADGGVFRVIDHLGDEIFTVTGGIDREDLQTILTVFDDRYDEGRAEGRSEAFEDLRRLIGAADQPAQEEQG